MNKVSPTKNPRKSRRKVTRADADFPIVAVGMSAGGLEAVTPFLRAMPPDTGMGIVIIQHLEPTRKSLLAELLSKDTKMPVVEIADGMKVEPNRVHVIAPGRTLLIEDNTFTLIDPKEKRGFRHPIDKFFTALVKDRGAKAIGVVLTGAGSNGTAGLLDIKQAGGLCIAQDPKTARFDSMPRHAIASGAVDYILAPEKMPEALVAFASHPYLEHPADPEALADGGPAGLGDVLTLIRARTGQDFRQYKPSTLNRRIYRRMGLARVEELQAYLDILRKDSGELDALVKDLAINVTGFFRDPAAWDALERDAIGPIVASATPNHPIRVWVPACSTGDEAYSLAIMVAELIERSGKPLSMKIFATDIGEQNLVTARKGIFAGSMVESLPPERLNRYFDKVGDDYQVKPELRESVLFASQNLLTDPPYSRMDMVSCRNLLIYLKPEAQKHILALTHFALREDGFLFLGNAETIGEMDDLFQTVSKRWRIYRRIGPPRSSAIDFSAWPSREKGDMPEAVAEPRIADVAARVLARRFAPASVVIDANFRIQHFHGPTDAYIGHPEGAPTQDLLTLARDGLAIVIRRIVQKAKTEGEVSALAVNNGERVLVTAVPLRGDGADALFLVTFSQQSGKIEGAPGKAPQEPPSDHHLELEAELKAARDELRSTIEQYETANEELKAANEEVTSVNEELQATNEELEASKEELQALNEELNAVNSQLERKVHELEDAQDDLKNLLSGNDIATIFLDTHMRVKWFSPAVKPLFDLEERDIGRPIVNFAQKFVDGDLIGKANAAMEHLAALEEEVRSDDGRIFSLRVQPYRTRDNRIGGAVASFIDISQLKKIQSEIAAARDFAEAIVKTVRDPLLVLDGDLRVVSANPAFYKMFEVRPAKIVGRAFFEIEGGQWDTPRLRELLERMLPEQGQIDDFEVFHDFPKLGERYILVNARLIAAEDGRSDLILIAKEDITERRENERHRTLLVNELSHRVKNTLAVVQSIATQTLRHSDTLDSFREAFLGRIQALARAHDVALTGGFETVKLSDLMRRALRPFQTNGQIVVGEVPGIEVNPATSQTLMLVFHELATNAVKYGALSVPEGRVSLDWRTTGKGDSRQLQIRWRERHGPAVKSPAHRGQGMGFIERSIRYDLKGLADVDFRKGGVEVKISFPLAEEAPRRSAKHRAEKVG